MNRSVAFAIAAVLTPLCFPAAAQESKLKSETVTSGLTNPWAVAFLPDGRMLVTERPGRLLLIEKNGDKTRIEGTPDVYARGQGGLLDVAIDPNFASNRFVYLSYAETGASGVGTAVARGVLSEDFKKFEKKQVIFRQAPKVDGNNHFGSRLVFGRDGKLFITLGDRFAHRDSAQDLGTTIGKIVRINTDGSIPEDNPFVSREGARKEIWSYGHRNIQGAALHPETGALFTAEHGARGGDELNKPEAGKNYGWPVISYGVNYDGSKIGEGTEKEGMEPPLKYWDPSFAPSGLAFYTGERFANWKGDLFIGGLSGMRLVRVDMEGEKPVAEEVLLGDLGERIRDVVQGPDGLLYVLTDDRDGKLLRLTPG